MRRRVVLAAVVLAGFSVTASVAAAAAPDAKAPAPKAGTWKLTQSFLDTKGGGFVVTHHHPGVKKLTTKVGSSEVQYCGKGTVKVLGKYRIHFVHKSGVRAYIVGKGVDVSTSYSITPVKAKVSFNGKKYTGDVRIRFEDARSGEGQIDFNPIAGLACDLVFDVHHAK